MQEKRNDFLGTFDFETVNNSVCVAVSSREKNDGVARCEWTKILFSIDSLQRFQTSVLLEWDDTKKNALVFSKSHRRRI